MRLIGHLPNEASAIIFSDYLYVQGIHNEVEREKEGWAIWIHSEDEISRARELLTHFVGNPTDPKYRQEARKALERREEEKKDEASARKRMVDGKKLFRPVTPYRIGPLTVILVVGCVVVAIYSKLGKDIEFLQPFFITATKNRWTSGNWGRLLPEVFNGEVWRLFSPVLLHFSELHLIFNMLCLLDFGGMVEGRLGTRRLLVLVLVIAALSNLGQYLMTRDPRFGGMSGVLYGLLGYIWMKGKFDPASGLYLHSQTVAMMLVWFVICFTPLLPVNIANGAHAVGLGVGVLWGYLSSLRANR